MEQLQRFILSFILVVAFCMTSQGQVFINYDDEVTIDEEGDWRFVPEIATVTIDVDEFPMAELVVTIPAEASVFIDEVMWLFADQDTSFAIPLQEIKERFPGEDSLRELIIYKKGIQPGDVSVKKGRFIHEAGWDTDQELIRASSERLKSPMEQFFFLSVLIAFFLIALFKVIYPAVLSFIVHPVLVFSTEDFSESNSISKFFTEEVLFFLVIFNMLLMGMIMVSAFFLEVPILEQLIAGDLNHLFLIWLLGTGILLLISLSKFVWLKLSALIFGISKIEFVHFFYMLRVASVILIGVYLILILCLANDLLPLTVLINYLLKGFFVLYILGVVMLFFMMVGNVSLKNYHLFSYLCTAELVPFLVLSKLIIG
jgi:hypothetical protein